MLAWQEAAGDDGVIRGPAANGRVAAVARSDVARAAVVVVLSKPRAHAGRTYDLRGAEAISRAHYGVPQWQLDAWVRTYTGIVSGQLARPTTAVQDLTGTPPIGLVALLYEADGTLDGTKLGD